MTNTEPGKAPGSPVYCAGPMFSLGDKREEKRISKVLTSAGFSTYLPHKEGIEVANALRMLTSPPLGATANFATIVDFARKIGFALDIFQVVERCNSVVFNMDGRVPDEGSAVEVAVAFAVCKPIVIFKSTVISLMAGYDSPMIQGLATNWTYATELTSLPGAVRTRSPPGPTAATPAGASTWVRSSISAAWCGRTSIRSTRRWTIPPRFSSNWCRTSSSSGAPSSMRHSARMSRPRRPTRSRRSPDHGSEEEMVAGPDNGSLTAGRRPDEICRG